MTEHDAIRSTTFGSLERGDTVLWFDTHYVVESIRKRGDSVDIVWVDTNDGLPYTYAAADVVAIITTEESTMSTPRPTIDFSGSSRATAREYAETLKGRCHKYAETNEVLSAVANGEQVDAYRLNAVLPDVFSGCATRAGQSMERRQYTKRARHLAHIAQAVLDNHADGLPAYAEGDRSRAVEDMKEAVKAATDEVARLTAALEAEKLRVANHAGTIRRLESIATAHLEDGNAARAEVSRLSLVIGYTRGLGTPEQAAQSLGYQHGLEGR